MISARKMKDSEKSHRMRGGIVLTNIDQLAEIEKEKTTGRKRKERR
jgi:hypothetical protein